MCKWHEECVVSLDVQVFTYIQYVLITVILIKVFLALEDTSPLLPVSSPGPPFFHLSCM